MLARNASGLAWRLGARWSSSTSSSTSSSAGGSEAAAAVSAGEYPGSKNFRPGKEGYAPGFPPPRGWSGEPKGWKSRAERRAEEESGAAARIAVPAPSAKQTHVPDAARAAADAGRLYRQKMREMRYEYFRESVARGEAKRAADAQKRAEMLVLVRERRDRLKRERREYEDKVLADPLSAANVMNAEGKTVLGNVVDGEPGYALEPPRVAVLQPAEANEQRRQERARNRRLAAERRHEAKIQDLMALFHEAESFVHYDNIDHKIMQFMDSVSFPSRSLAEMFELAQKSGGTVLPAEIAARTDELRNTLQGTAGPQNRLGYDGLVRWLDAHPEDRPDAGSE
ncbi:hypothetical protein H4R18_005298 [Coemansia javaensis]|uniref:Uncharacterized protein n=1 Tax=Coemansia javaensis TaxID=2761396 RepID=A0A9W8H9K8_9FUNG|nr:hypothetical protein H4R18_005298 [Coemansia javaensis]